MLETRTAKSGWSTGSGNILTIKKDIGVSRDLLTEYGRLFIGNIDAHFAIYKSQAGRQLQNSAQMSEFLLASICPKTAEIVLA